MKSLRLIPIVVFALLSCNQPAPSRQAAPETPKALQEGGSAEYSLLSKGRGEDDLVEKLYSELVDKTPELKDLENRISYLYEAKTDSVTGFNNFNEKNTSYYSAANRHLDQITDSALKDKVRSLINGSLNKYNTQIARHKSLITILNSKSIRLGDMHIILKLVKTSGLIEKYQKDNIPDARPINRVINQYDKTIQKVDSLAK